MKGSAVFIALIVAFVLIVLPTNANKTAVTATSKSVKAVHVAIPPPWEDAFSAEDGSPPIDGPYLKSEDNHIGETGPREKSVPETRWELPEVPSESV